MKNESFRYNYSLAKLILNEINLLSDLTNKECITKCDLYAFVKLYIVIVLRLVGSNPELKSVDESWGIANLYGMVGRIWNL